MLYNFADLVIIDHSNGSLSDIEINRYDNEEMDAVNSIGSNEGEHDHNHPSGMSDKPLWYVINVYSGYEERVYKKLMEIIASGSNVLSDVFLPMENVKEVKKGKIIKRQKSLISGYLFVKMIMGEEAMHIIADIPYVAVFIGGKEPIRVSDAEIESFKKSVVNLGDNVGKMFVVGDTVKVKNGDFASFIGKIEKIDDLELSVSFTILGEKALMRFNLEDVERVSE